MGPDAPTNLPVVNVGLTSSGLGTAAGTPPLGEAISPVSGAPGDGLAVVSQVGGWSTGPGAVRWHGGQWVMPYSLRPGSTLLNVSCDIWNPALTPAASVLVEVVSSNGQVLGSSPVSASSSVVTRAWPFVGTHAVVDGEQLVVRLSPRDVLTGAWTTELQDTTVIGCAVNATDSAPEATTEAYSIGFAIPGQGVQLFPGAASTNASLSLNTSTSSSNLPLRMRSGRTLSAWSLRVIKNSVAGTISARLWRTMPAAATAIQVGTTQILSAQSVTSIGQAGLMEVAPAGVSYFIEVQGGGVSGDFVEDYQITMQ